VNRSLTFAAAAALTVLFAHAGCGAGDPGVDPGPDAMEPPPIDAMPDTPDAMNDPSIDGKLVINEVMVANATTISDGGKARDWIELYNPTDTALRLQGYGITDELMVPKKHIFGPSVMIPAHGFLLLWADNEPALGATHLRFQLAKEPGEVALTRPDGSFIDRLQYGAQEVDFSAAREPDGSNKWVIEWHPSPGVANPSGSGTGMGLEDVSMPPEQVPAAGDLSEQILGYDAEPQFTLTIGPDQIIALRNQPREYVPASITFRGREWGPVGVRLKGVNSFQPIDRKPSFRLDFDRFVEGGRFFGIEHMVLNNMDDDFSMMHERLAYWLARGAHVPAPRCNHARVSVNGAPAALYAHVEAIKHKFLERWFADADGTLYEATDVDFQPQYINAYEIETGPDDRTLLVGLSTALANPDPDAAIAAAAQYVDLDEWRRFWALESVVGQYDAYPYSFPGDDIYLYADPTTHKLNFIPSGMDETFYSSEIDPSSVMRLNGKLATACRASASCFQLYVNAVWDMQAQAESMNLEGERTRVVNQIAPWVLADQRKPYPDSEVSAYQTNLYWFIHERRTKLTMYFPPRA
jgi:hypothetical protein